MPFTQWPEANFYIVHNCLNLNKISLSNAMICRIKQKSFQFLFEKLGVRDQSNVNEQAVPRFWCSDGERPLWWDQSRTRNNQIVSPSWTERGASWDVGYGSNQLGQIRRCTTIDCMEYIYINTSPTDCYASGADTLYGFRHVVPPVPSLAGI